MLRRAFWGIQWREHQGEHQGHQRPWLMWPPYKNRGPIQKSCSSTKSSWTKWCFTTRKRSPDKIPLYNRWLISCLFLHSWEFFVSNICVLEQLYEIGCRVDFLIICTLRTSIGVNFSVSFVVQNQTTRVTFDWVEDHWRARVELRCFWTDNGERSATMNGMMPMRWSPACSWDISLLQRQPLAPPTTSVRRCPYTLTWFAVLEARSVLLNVFIAPQVWIVPRSRVQEFSAPRSPNTLVL